MSNKNKFEFRFEEKSGVRFVDVPSGTAFVRDYEQPSVLYVKRPDGTLCRLFKVRDDSGAINAGILSETSAGFESSTRVRPVDLKGFFGEYI